MAEQGTAGSSTAEDVPSLAESIGEIMGDYIPDESPSTGSTDEGAPPDSGAPTGSENAANVAGSEGDAANAGLAGAPPADAADAPLDEEGQGESDEYAPFTYTVNGEQRAADGIRLVGEHGAIVDAEFLPVLQQRLSERDHLYERQQADYQRYGRPDHLERLSNWEIQGPNGSKQTLTGREGFEAQRVALSRALGSLQVIDRALSDPNQFARLVTVVQDEQGNARIVPDPNGMQNLRTMIENAAIRSEMGTRRFVQTLAMPSSAPEQPISAVAMPTVESIIRDQKITGLTDEDKQFLAHQLEHGGYVRATTAAERQSGLGPQIVKPSFVALVKREAARMQQTARVAQSATAAARQNQTKLNAARQRVPLPAPARQPVAQQRVTDADAAWDVQERANAQALRSAMGVR